MIDIWKNRKWKPMLLEEISKPFNDKDYYFEIKFDGFRALVFASPNEVYIQSRNGNDLTSIYPELQSIKKLVKKKVIFDGEIIATINGVPSFSKLQKRSRIKSRSTIKTLSIEDPVTFIAFDLLYEEQDITNEKLYKRKKRLSKYKDTDTFIKTKVFPTDGIKLFKEVKKMNLEGIVAKNKNSTYHINERTNDFIKIKNLQRDEFIIGGYIEKENTLSILLGEYIEGKLHFVGKVSVGKKSNTSKILLKSTNSKNPFVDFNENAIYIKPTNTCFVEYLERTKQGHLRHPTLKEYR